MGATFLTKCVLQGICACLSYNVVDQDVCFGPVPSYQRFGSRSDYDITVSRFAQAADVPLAIPDGCRPSLFYIFQRHTTRYPKDKNINASSTHLPDIQEQLADEDNKSKMCEKDVKAILNWTNPFTLELDGLTTESGRKAVREQVKRLRKRFVTVFENRKPLQNIVMDFSERGNRSFETGETFLREWFGDAVYNEEIGKSVRNLTNPLNNFQDTCEALLQAKGAEYSSPQREALRDSKPYKSFKKTIEKRLGFDLRKKQLRTIMNQCAFEMAAFGNSPWCALFSEEDLRMMDLDEDAESFDLDSYGTPRNEKVACPVAADLLSHIKRSAANDTEGPPNVVLHFSHSGALKRLVTLLGIAREFDRDCSKRAWNLSNISPFNANLNAVYYKCPGEQQDKVAVLLNEKLVKLSECKEAICDAADFVTLLESKARNCDLVKLCSS